MNTNDSSPRTAAPSAASSSGLRQRKSSANPKICDESKVSLPRLVNRNFPYHQSANRIAVVNEKHHSHIWPLLLRDWFHVLMRMPTFGSILFLLVIWTSVILIFAGIYVKIDQYNVGMDCGLGDPGAPIAWGTSFAFSLETCTTVGCKYFFKLSWPHFY